MLWLCRKSCSPAELVREAGLLTGAVGEFMRILGKRRIQVTALYLTRCVFEVIFLRIFAFIAKDWSINKPHGIVSFKS